MLFLLTLITTLMISIILFFFNFFLMKKMNKFREKMSPFECGFDSQQLNRIPFSLQFYLISVIFLIFDVEISIILPMIINKNFLLMKMVYLNMLFIFLILLIGLYMEWYEGALKWMKLK